MTRAVRFIVDQYLVLPLGAAIALLWANSQPEVYFTFAHRLAFATNDIGMAFFLALITKEVVEAAPKGAPHTWRRLMLAVVAAAGGIAGSLAVYFGYLRFGDESSVLARGWPVLCATDIAFSYLIARIVCRQQALPFLVLVAIVSDAIGLAILEVRYPIADVRIGGAALLMAGIFVATVMRRCDVGSFWPYILASGTPVWWGLFLSGFHPALALVPIVPFLKRASRNRGFLVDAPPGARDALGRFQRTAKYPVQIVLFFFALVNAGVILRSVGTGTWALLVAALAGKPLGILIAVAIAAAAGLRLPRNITWGDMVVIALTSSTGFSFALFFALRTFAVGPLLGEVKLGVLLTVALSPLAIVAARLLRVGRFAQRRTPPQAARAQYVGV